MYIHGSEKGSAADNGAARIFEHADPPARCIRLFLPINPSGLGDGHATVANDRGVYDAFRGEPHSSFVHARAARLTALHTRFSSDDYRNEDLFRGRSLCIRDFHRARILMDGF